MRNNVFSTFISMLGVKHTVAYANRYFNEHPHKYDLYGISKMLSDYGIENMGIQLSEKEELFQLETPFVAHVGIDFMVVYKVTEDRIHYVSEGKKVSIPTHRFFDVWTKVVLIAEPDAHSIEPGYADNRKIEWMEKVQQGLLLVALCALMVSSMVVSGLFRHIGLLLLLVLNLAGAYVSYLLILKQLKIYSSFSDTICSLFRQSDCNDVLQSKAARPFGMIGWSEIGLAYFLSNLLIVLFFPVLLPFLALVNICALPYSFWSVWYQKARAKQWCPLCLIVQALLWGIFGVDVWFHYIHLPAIDYASMLAGCLYVVPILLVNRYTPSLGSEKKVQAITQELNSLKGKAGVFQALMQEQPAYEVSVSTSAILFGNTQAPYLITIVTNPHCEPCGRMHETVIQLLDTYRDKICLQYLFTHFPNLEESSRFLIGTYLCNDTSKAEAIYTEWFTRGGKCKRESFMAEHPVSADAASVNDEWEKHAEWKRYTKINATPTVLINGHQLPSIYQLGTCDLFELLGEE